MNRDASSHSHDPAEFRAALSHFPTSVVIVTAMDTEPVGVVIGSFTSVSLRPPLVGFLVDNDSRTWPRIRRAGRFTVNLVAGTQQELCRAMSRQAEDRFTGTSWRPSPAGAPIFDGVPAWIDCEVRDELEAGDHRFVVGSVENLCIEDATAEPMIFLRGVLCPAPA